MINAIAKITGIPSPINNPKINGILDFSGVGSGGTGVSPVTLIVIIWSDCFDQVSKEDWILNV